MALRLPWLCDADLKKKQKHPAHQPTNQPNTSSNRKVSEGASTITTNNRRTATLAQWRWLLRQRQVHRHLGVAAVHLQLLILHLLPLRQRPGHRVHNDGWSSGRRCSWRPPSAPQSPPKRNANSRSNAKTRSSHDSPPAKLPNRYSTVYVVTPLFSFLSISSPSSSSSSFYCLIYTIQYNAACCVVIDPPHPEGGEGRERERERKETPSISFHE